MNREIVFVYDHFYPDHSAGGPVTSLYNLAIALAGKFNIRIITSAFVYDTGEKMHGIELNRWTQQGTLTVWYADSSKSIAEAVESLPPTTALYLNGLFSLKYFLGVLKASRKRKLDVVVTPRGMLQRGALAQGALKKKVYLNVLRMLGWLSDARWHATDQQEEADIRKHFRVKSPVAVIPNFPRQPAPGNTTLHKEKGILKLVYFSLISEKKNLQFLIDLLLASPPHGITLDVVGPIKDKNYADTCLQHIERSNGIVRYLGDCKPDQVIDLLSKYHMFVLPTRGENFGHAIVEAMSSWRPVMISVYTPWNDITPFNGGFALPLNAETWKGTLVEARDWSQAEFDRACSGAIGYILKKIDAPTLRSKYIALFQN